MMASKENTHQLIEGCDKGDLSSVNDLIAQGGVDVNGQNDVGECPLFTAVLHGHHDLAKVLLQHGANANTRNGCLGQTALMVASEIGCAEICELLLEFGADADVEVQNIDGWSLLLQECNMGYKNIAKLHKAVENVQKYNSKSCYWTAIMIASKNGDYDVVKLILEKEPRKRDIKSALRLACENKHVKVARLLLEHLAAHNNHGWSAFIFACLYNCREVLETLLIEGTDVNFTDRCGLTALIIACTSGHYEIAKLLLDHGSYVNAQKWNGQTALMSASRGGHTSIIKLLLDHQAATDIQDDKGWSSLMIASDRGFTEIVRLLADHGANTRLCNKDGSSALTIATRAEHAEVVKQLTDHRANKEAWMVPECTQSPDKLESSSSPTMRRLRLATNDSGYYSPSPLTQSTCESNVETKECCAPQVSQLRVTKQMSAITTRLRREVQKNCEQTPNTFHFISKHGGHAEFQEYHAEGPHAQESIHKSAQFSEAQNKAQVPFLFHYVLECDSKGREYTIEGHDITLRIPKGAIAEGTKLHFEIGVAAYGPFKFPENSQPISPIVWLCILDGDSSMLKKPFHLILPHCLIGLSRERLSDHHVAFAKASHLLREQYYNFNKCEIDPLFASSGDKCYGVLKSDHCCFNCLTHDTARETRTDISYCLVRVECTEFTPTRNEVYFAVIYYLDTCKKAINDQFKGNEYRIHYGKAFKFGPRKARIKLKPQLKDDKRCEIALEPSKAKIRESEVDFSGMGYDEMKLMHDMQTYPPRVKMTVVILEAGNHVKIPIKFDGCLDGDPLSLDLIFPLACYAVHSPTSTTSTASISSVSHLSHTIITESKPHLIRQVFKELLPLAAKWKTIGCLLGIHPDDLEKIKVDEGAADDRLLAMITKWFSQTDPPPTWANLIEAVKQVDTSKAQEMWKHTAN